MLPETYLAEKQSFVVQKPFHSLASSRYSVSQAGKQAGRQPARAAHLDTKRTTTTTIVLRLCFVCTHTHTDKEREIEIYTHKGRQGDRETDKLANYTINSNSKSPLTDLLYKWFYISFYVVQPELYTESESGRVGTLEWRLCCANTSSAQPQLSSIQFSSATACSASASSSSFCLTRLACLSFPYIDWHFILIASSWVDLSSLSLSPRSLSFSVSLSLSLSLFPRPKSSSSCSYSLAHPK